MKKTASVPSASLLLRLRVLLTRSSAVAMTALTVLPLAIGGMAWLFYAHLTLEEERDEVMRQLAANKARAALAAMPASLGRTAPAAAPASDNLDAFYAALGPRRYAGEQVRTLFALAAKNGLSLSQGEYKSAYDRNAQVRTYQVNLPVKGSYGAVWQFALGALRAIPFASLDEISFRRDGIADPVVEARLRLTLYLSDAAGGDGR